LICPECGSKRIYKDGFRYLGNGPRKQRYVCRDCEYHFSEKISNGFQTRVKSYKQSPTNVKRQICVLKAKNLNNATKTKNVAVDKKNTQRGQIVHFCFHLEKQGYAEVTIKLNYTVLKVLMDRGANLADSESVKEVIARQSWSQNRRRIVITSYNQFFFLAKNIFLN
jgi:transposase-like protein